jgi:hypothetical protein
MISLDLARAAGVEATDLLLVSEEIEVEVAIEDEVAVGAPAEKEEEMIVEEMIETSNQNLTESKLRIFKFN